MAGRTRHGLSGGRARPHLIALEPRMMFDAAMAATTERVVAAADPAADPAAVAEPTHDAYLPERGQADLRVPAPAETAAREIVFIDTSVAGYRQLADRWADRGEVVLVDAAADGIDQMRAALAGRSDIAAIHIVGHGERGLLLLGTTRIDGEAIAGELAGSLAAIGRSLADDGDILLYGCDFAEGSVGADALARFAAATGADVAASTDTSGGAAQGGDWELEARQGLIEAAALDGGDWAHTLDPNVIVPISVGADTLTVTDGGGAVIATGATGYDGQNRTADVGVGAVARWAGAATVAGTSYDLKATVVALSAGDAVRFNRPGIGDNGDDPTFLLRDLQIASTNNGNGASVQLRWELVETGTDTALPANVQFTIADIDGVGGNPDSRETVSTSTDRLAYYTRERISDIHFTNAADRITASGTQNENLVANAPIAPKSAATFDWTQVSQWTLTYTLAPNNGAATQAQFLHDGNAQFAYADPVYLSIPRLDLDGNDSSAAGNDARITFTEDGAAVPIVDGDLVVENPMPSDGITGGVVTLTNARPGDTFIIGTLPANITATVGTGGTGTIVVTLTGAGSETEYETALKAIAFRNTSQNPDTVRRVITIGFSNDTLTSPVATSRIDVVAINDAPSAVADTASTAEDIARIIAVLANDTDAEGNSLAVTAATAAHGSVVRNGNGTITYTPDANYSGNDTISYTISDGQGGTAIGSVAVTIDPRGDAPVNTLPAAQTMAEEGVLILSAANGNAITVDSIEGGTTRVTLAATRGTLTLGSTAGITFLTGDGSDDAAMTFTGTLAALNAALDGTAFRPTADYHGPARIDVTTVRPRIDGEDFYNGGMEMPYVADGQFRIFDEAAVPGWETDASDGKIEVWGNGHMGVTAYAGRQFFELSANEPAAIFQTFRPAPGETTSISFAHRGRAGIDTMELTAIDLGTDGLYGTGDDTIMSQQRYSDGNTGWGYYTQAIGLSASGNLIRVEFRAISNAGGDPTAGNFLDAVTVNRNPPNDRDADALAITVTPVVDIAADAATTAEDTAVTYDPIANDSFENAGRTISAVDGRAIVAGGPALAVANGTVALDAANRFTFTPAADYTGTSQFSYTVTSGGADETATETITVTPVNDAPVAAAALPDRSGADASSVTIATAGGFTDPDATPPTYAATGLPPGLSIDAATGIITGTLGRSASQANAGRYTVTVTATDPQGSQASQSFVFTATNPPPVAGDDAAGTVEDAGLTITVLTNDGDPDGDTPLMVSAPIATNGTAVANPDGTITYTPDADFTGTDTIRYTLTDADGATDEGLVTVTVGRAQDAPTARDDAATTVEDSARIVAVLANDSDPDGDPLTVTAASALHGSVVRNANGTITYTPDADYAGPDTISYTIADGRGGTDSAMVAVTVTPVQDAPLRRGTLPAAAAVDGQPVSIAAAPGFREPDGEVLVYTATGLPAGLAIDAATGVIAGTPGRSASQPAGGAYAIVVTATDPAGASTTQGFTLTIANPAPTAAADAATTAEETPVTIAVLANDGDADGDPLSVAAATADHGRAAVNADGTITYTPDADFVGTDTLRYTIVDGEGGSASATVAIQVAGGNDAPEATPLPPRGDPDAATVAVPTAAAFADRDGDRLSYAATGLPAGLAIDPVTGIVAGAIAPGAASGGPAGDGRHPVVVTATDPSGASAATGFTWTVDPVAPVARDDAFTVAEDGTAALAVLANDSDSDADPLTIVAATATGGTARIEGDRIVFTPDADFVGTATIRYTIADPAGNRASATATLIVTPVNDAPVRTGASVPPRDLFEGQAVAIEAAPLFADADGDALRYAIAGLPAGLAIDPVTGAITGTIAGTVAPGALDPDGGVYRGTVTATDPSGASVAATIEIRVLNRAPVAIDDVAMVREDDAIVIAVLAGDGDADGDRLTVTAASAGAGSVAINPDGTLTYRPAANFAGSDTIRYTIVDGRGGSAEAVVRVTVAPVNDAPIVPGRDPVPAIGGRPVVIDALAGATDVEGDRLTITAATAATGVVAIAPGGQLVYAPPLGFVGTTTISVTVADGQGGSTVRTIAVRVADGRFADIEQLLAIGRVRFPDPDPAVIAIATATGEVRHPLTVRVAVDGARSLRGSAIGDRPVGDAVAAIRSLRGTAIDRDAPIAAEVARLDRLADRRDAGDRLFDQRWGDVLVQGLTGFSAAADAGAGVMIESVVRGGAIYLEVRDTATDGRAAIRSIDVAAATGERHPDWLRVDPRGLAIVERGADMDELHLLVRVTREDGRTTTTRITVQGATGEVEIDRPRAAPLHATLQTPADARADAAARLAASFQ